MDLIQLSRAMVKAIEEETDLTFQIVNKPGGGGTAAIPDFMIAPADGHTIMQHIDTAVAAYAKGDIRENPAEDWIPLCTTQITFSQIYIRPEEDRYTDWDSFLAYAKENPGKLSMGLLGKVGSMELVTMRQISEALDLDLRQVTFDKPAETYGSLIGAQVDVLFEQPGDVRSFLDAGQMKPILTILNERPAAFADVPTHREVGADFDPLTRFRGFYVKAPKPLSGGACAMRRVQPASTRRCVSPFTSSDQTPMWCAPGASRPSQIDPGAPSSSSTCMGPSAEYVKRNGIVVAPTSGNHTFCSLSWSEHHEIPSESPISSIADPMSGTRTPT